MRQETQRYQGRDIAWGGVVYINILKVSVKTLNADTYENKCVTVVVKAAFLICTMLNFNKIIQQYFN